MYVLPDNKKEELRKPLGKVVKELDKNEIKGKIVSVGDVVTMVLKEEGIEPDIAIVDYKIERKEYKGEKFNA